MNTFYTNEKYTVRKLPIFILTIVAVLGLSFGAYGQTPSPSPATPAVSGVIGEVKAIDPVAKQIIVRADNGVISTVNISDKTQYKRMALGAKTLDTATNITLADVGQGDRVWARWRAGSDQKTVPTPQLIVMSKADLAKKQEQDRAEWRRRGVSGIVSSVNPSTQEITVSSRSLMGATQAVIIPVTDKVMMRRYPPDTIPKYSEARPSKFEEVKIGDQLRALGDKSADGTHLTAEEIVFGTFRIAGGTVTAIDVATNQIKINDLQTKKPLTIIIKPDSVIRRFPEGGGAMLAGMGGGGGGTAGAGGGAGKTGQSPQGPGAQGAGTQGPRSQGAGPGGPQGGGRGGNMADLLERLPIISIGDLKVGDTVLMSSLQGSDPTQLTAISLVSGVEPLLAMMSRPQQGGGGQARPAADLNGSFGGMFGGIGVP
jgi:co-chaperonin GroES (HSP10)